ncbi:MAG: VCBS repeat-containing protein, partial [Cyclobacteriaceae bacterium]
MKRLLVLCTLGFTLIAMPLSAQEICNNGRDDDNDGFIDCYDNNCSASTFCKGFYLGEDALCEATPPAFPKFTMALDFTSPDETTNHLSRMAVGDLNRDGKPEIITMNRYTDKLFILNGTDGSIQKQVTATFDPNWEVAIANIDNDNCGEIFFFGYYDPSGSSNDGNFLFAYDCNLNFLWRTAERLRGDPINYGLADFDGDGKVELYVKDEIYDAHTGVRIIKSTSTSWTRTNGGPVAVDIEGDDKLELVLGCSIYSVNLGTRTLDAGSLTLLKSAPEYFIRNEYNATSVADYNQDGFLDVLASGSTNSHGDNTTVFFWDVRNNTMLTYSDPIPGNITIFACPDQTGEYYKDGWKNGTGRINIGDLDGDGRLNASYVSGKYLYALDENMNPLPWSPKLVNEETSGYTGCTLFDFNGDGKSEIVYRDERFLYIINGTDGTIYNQQACVSRTNREYPIVADVDADGSTELCVTCGFNDTNAINNFCNLNYSRYSHVRVFKSAGDPWVPARRVWNQHGYFNVNVNDDLTIPIKQQKHHIVFSTGSCTVGPNRPLNTFLNQTPFLNLDGCPTYKSPDLAYVSNSLTVNPPTCPNQNFTVSFQITNQGDIGLSGNVPITFYSGNPTQAGAVKLSTVVVPLDDFEVDDIEPLNNISVSGPGGPFTLYIVLNDDGSTVPTPISLPNTNFLECDYNDNIISA